MLLQNVIKLSFVFVALIVRLRAAENYFLCVKM